MGNYRDSERSAKPRRLPWCARCHKRRAIREWFIDPELRLSWCQPCIDTVGNQRRREGMPTYREFAEVDRTLPNGTYVRILGNPEPWWDGVYQLRNGGNNAQGVVWGARVFPGPDQLWGYQGSRPVGLRPWGRDMPPEYRVPGIDDE